MVIMRKLSTYQSWIKWIFFLSFVFLSIQYTSPQYSYFQDSHDKLIQTYSIWKNHFLSDALYYPAKVFDSNYEYIHLTKNLFLKIDERLVSAFPIQFAYLMAPFLFVFPLSSLVYTSLLFLILSFFLLRRYYQFSFLLLWISFFGTFLWPLSWEYSELPAIFAFSVFCLLPILKRKKETIFQLLGGIGLSWIVMVRLDTLPFFLLFFLSYFYFIWKDKNRNGFFKEILSLKILIFSGIIGILFQFLINTILVHHFLGSRYLANMNGFSVEMSTRLQWFQSLLFYGEKKIGFFVYLPITVFLLIFYGIKFNKINRTKKSLFLSMTMTIFLIPFLAPNDGFNNWGPRYFTVLLIPYLLLLKPILSIVFKKRKWIYSIFFSLLFLYSGTLGLIGAKIQKSKTNLIKKFQSVTNTIKPDIIVFTDYLNLYSMGSDYIKLMAIVSYTTESNTKLIHSISEMMPNKKIAFVDWHPSILTQEIRRTMNAEKLKGGFPISDWNSDLLENTLKNFTFDYQRVDIQTYRIWLGTIAEKESK